LLRSFCSCSDVNHLDTVFSCVFFVDLATISTLDFVVFFDEITAELDWAVVEIEFLAIAQLGISQKTTSPSNI
jgi:hypothetical protein